MAEVKEEQPERRENREQGEAEQIASEKLPARKALFWILASVLVVWCCVLGFYLIWGKIKEGRLQDPAYSIVAISQKAYSQDTLPCVYLAELMGLAKDKPTNMYAFFPKKAEEALLRHVFFKKAHVQLKKPGVVTVEYEMRAPYAKIFDFENMAISEDLYLFPLSPCYAPKRLPEIIVGTSASEKEEKRMLDSEKIALAFSVIEEAKKFAPQFFLARVDVRAATSTTKCPEIIVLVEESVFEAKENSLQRYFVRLPRRAYKKALQRFFTLLPYVKEVRKNGSLDKQEQIVDMRVDHIALVKRV
jgi:hypothetical protein